MSDSPRRGLRLIEVLVVFAIAIMAIGLLLPAPRRIRGASERTQCQNNLRQMMLALHNFHSMNSSADAPTQGQFPAGCIGPGDAPEKRLSWVVALLPQLEEEALYRKFNFEKGYESNLPATQTQIKMLLCPAGNGKATTDPVTHYIAMAGIGRDAASQPAGTAGNGFMGYDRLTNFDMIRDGSSTTIALMETRSNLGPWARGGASTLRGFDPTDLPLNGDNRPFGGHSGGMIAAWCDGAVHPISATIDPQKLAAMITINGGEAVVLED